MIIPNDISSFYVHDSCIYVIIQDFNFYGRLHFTPYTSHAVLVLIIIFYVKPLNK